MPIQYVKKLVAQASALRHERLTQNTQPEESLDGDQAMFDLLVRLPNELLDQIIASILPKGSVVEVDAAQHNGSIICYAPRFRDMFALMQSCQRLYALCRMYLRITCERNELQISLHVLRAGSQYLIPPQLPPPLLDHVARFIIRVDCLERLARIPPPLSSFCCNVEELRLIWPPQARDNVLAAGFNRDDSAAVVALQNLLLVARDYRGTHWCYTMMFHHQKTYKTVHELDLLTEFSCGEFGTFGEISKQVRRRTFLIEPPDKHTDIVDLLDGRKTWLVNEKVR